MYALSRYSHFLLVCIYGTFGHRILCHVDTIKMFLCIDIDGWPSHHGMQYIPKGRDRARFTSPLTFKGHELRLFVCTAHKGSPAWLARVQISEYIQTKLSLTAFVTENNKQSLKTDFRDCIQLSLFLSDWKSQVFCSARTLQCLHPSYRYSCRYPIKLLNIFLGSSSSWKGNPCYFLTGQCFTLVLLMPSSRLYWYTAPASTTILARLHAKSDQLSHLY